MIRYKNTDNGVILEVPDFYASTYDRASNLVRLEDSPAPSPEPTGDPWVEETIAQVQRKPPPRKSGPKKEG